MKDSKTLSALMVEQAKNGNQEAFEKLVRAFQADVRFYLLRRINNASVADDLAQEVFLSAIKNIGQLQNNNSVRSWLLGISHNKLVDYLRKVSRRKSTQVEQIESLLAEEQLDREKAVASDRQEDVFESLKDCISLLKPKAQMIVQKFYYDDQTAEKISAESNVSGSAIRMSLLRIRKTLAKCIRQRLGAEFTL